jgi:UV DNA damage endonuclease
MIGLCCQFLEESISPRGKVSHKNIIEENVLQYNRFLQNKYSNEQVIATWEKNIKTLNNVLPKIFNLGIKSFRLSSNYFPLYDQLGDSLINNNSIKQTLSSIGDFVIKNKMRVSCHPSQFVVLSSKSEAVIQNSISNLTHHAWMLDCMGLDLSPYYSINIHGGVKGEIKTLIDKTNQLPNNVKSRLTFENDERCFNVQNLFDIYKDTGVPITFDWHHDSFNDSNLNTDQKLKLIFESWGKVKPLMHLSNTEPEFQQSGSFTDKRKHSFYTHYIPDQLKEILNSNQCDCDWEFKGKNLAIFKAVEDFNLNLN